MKTRVTILHPFTAAAAGAVERSIPTYHSQPHLKAMVFLNRDYGYQCNMAYFTPKLLPYKKTVGKITYQFYPVSKTLNGDHKKWKKQTSNSCLNSYKKDCPEVTIINMSGHSSKFSHQLAACILKQGKAYIAMLGGQHYTNTQENRTYYKNANHILVHTYLQKKDMESMPLFEGCDIRVFPLGVDCNVFTPGNITKDYTSPKLLYVGRIIDWKRIHLAINALKYLHDGGFETASLKIIGPTVSDTYLLELKKLIKELKLEDYVHFLGHKEHNELPKYFQEADLFMLPSDKETFGMVMIEAMACGTPVAGMNCPGGPADVITHNVDGVLTDLETYNTAVFAFFKNETLREKISENARKKAVDFYSIEATYHVLKTSVNSILK
ncbi:glycosyltransferase family 4 protein [Lacinutrix undariae]